MAKSKTAQKMEKVFTVLNKKTNARIGFADIDLWADTGVYALNRRMSNSYFKGMLYGRVVSIYGESGSGKSLFLAQTAANAQRDHNAYVLWIDVEGAVSDKKTGEQWFLDAGINIGSNNFSRIHVTTFAEALTTMAETISHWREDEGKDEMAPLFVVFDSFSYLQTDTMVQQNTGKKDLTQDMGQKARQLKDLLIRISGMIEGLRVLVTGVAHVYMSQEMYGPKHKLGGGMGPAYTASQSLMFAMTKLTNKKAKIDCPHLVLSTASDDENKVIGIHTTCTVLKLRFAKPFEVIELDAVYGKGIDKYSGLFDLLMDDGIIYSPTQGWYEFKRLDGSTSTKFRRADYLKYVDELLQIPPPTRTAVPEEVIDQVIAEAIDPETGEVLDNV
jgi:RecA/RadA recombinase